MAIKTQLGGIRLSDNRITTVMPIQLMLDHTIGGMAFEPKEKVGESYDHLDERVKALMPARGAFQRSFFARSMRDVKVTNAETGEKRTEREATGWSPTAKYRNSTGELRRYVEGPFLDTPPLTATFPAFVLYSPEKVEGVQRDGFDARMGGEFYFYDIDPVNKFMLADGESRHLAIELALAPNSNLPGSRREKLKNMLVTVEIIHGIPPQDMGQMFADLNGKGVNLTKNAVLGLDVRDRWAKATKKVFTELGVPLMTTGRQITAVAQAENKHLLVGQAIAMVRAVGLGSFSKAVSTSSYDDVIKSPKEFDKVVKAAVTWFGMILDHFDMPTLDNGERSAEIFTDKDRVLRAMPVKVALGLMGHAWVETNLPKQFEFKAALSEINWRVDPRWQGIAGKVSQKTEKKKVDGKTVREPIDGEYTLAASGAKEIGSAAARALTSPDTVAGRKVRGLNPNSTSEDVA
jgi:hypothetical protein